MVYPAKKILLTLVLAGGLFQPLAQAQTAKTTWTLPECIDYAITNNLQVKQAAMDAEVADINVRQARANQLPSLNASSSYGFSFGRSIDPTENTFTNEQIQSALKTVRDARAKQEAELAKARQELREVVTVRQEAKLVLSRILD